MGIRSYGPERLHLSSKDCSQRWEGVGVPISEHAYGWNEALAKAAQLVFNRHDKYFIITNSIHWWFFEVTAISYERRTFDCNMLCTCGSEGIGYLCLSSLTESCQLPSDVDASSYRVGPINFESNRPHVPMSLL